MRPGAAKLLWLAVVLAHCTACTTTPRRDATATLISRPDFPAAAKAAPDWVRAALRTVTQLEADLQRAENRTTR